MMREYKNEGDDDNDDENKIKTRRIYNFHLF